MKNLTTLTSRRKEILMKVLELGLRTYLKDGVYSSIERLKIDMQTTLFEYYCCKNEIKKINKSINYINEEIQKLMNKTTDDIKIKNLLNKQIKEKSEQVISLKKYIEDNEKEADFYNSLIKDYQYQLDNFVDIKETKKDIELLKKDVSEIKDLIFSYEEITRLINTDKFYNRKN